MREGRQLVRDSSRYASEDRRRSWFHLISTVLVFVTVLTLAALPLPLVVRLACSVLAAFVHVRMFVIFHDFQHGAILPGSKIARVILDGYGILTLSPASIWRHTHDHHHINNTRRLSTDAIGSYPVISTEQYESSSKLNRFLYALYRNPVIILFGYITVFLYSFGIKAVLADPRRHWDAGASMIVHIGIAVALGFTRPDLLVFLVLIPSFLASTMGTYLFYAQHNYPGAKMRQGDDWDYVFAALQSSSYIKMGPVMNWFTANIGYHHVHHLNSRIPFYRLPEAMAGLEALQHPTVTTLRPRDILRCLRLKLWDAREDRLVTFPEWKELKAKREREAIEEAREKAAAPRPAPVAHAS